MPPPEPPGPSAASIADGRTPFGGSASDSVVATLKTCSLRLIRLLAGRGRHRGHPAALLAQQPTFKTGTQIVPLYVTVTDADKRLVPDLVKDDFDVSTTAQPVTLTLFQNEPEPFSVRRHARHERQHDADRSICCRPRPSSS